MDNRTLWESCCGCKFALRDKGGNPDVCKIIAPRIGDDSCGDFTLDLGRMRPKGSYRPLKALLGIVMVVTTLVFGLALFIKGVSSFLRWIAPPINRDNLDLYLPRNGRATGRRRR